MSTADLESEDEFTFNPYEGINFDLVPALALQSEDTLAPHANGERTDPSQTTGSNSGLSFVESKSRQVEITGAGLGAERQSNPQAISPIATNLAATSSYGASFPYTNSRSNAPIQVPDSEDIGQTIIRLRSLKRAKKRPLVVDRIPLAKRHKEELNGDAHDAMPGKVGADSEAAVSLQQLRGMLETFGDEMTCPICFDLFARAHIGNPCGHSFCGECALDWIAKNEHSPVCAVCRTPLAMRSPMLPNVAMDSTVHKHIDLLRRNRDADWLDDGPRWKEWTLKNERWKTNGAERLKQITTKKKNKNRRKKRHVSTDS